MYRPEVPDGENASLTSAISPDGRPETGATYRVPPRCGVAVRVAAGQSIRVINTHGTQVCDFWAVCDGGPHEFLSMAHCHTETGGIMPATGDVLVSNRRRPMLTITADDSPGVHDTVIASCDWPRYQVLGCTEYHDNCADNFRMALIAIGEAAVHVPDPFNLWMNIPVSPEGRISWEAPVSSASNSIVMRAETDIIAVMSACPQDITPVNGDALAPTELHFRIEA
ncbi:MAG: urea carboxylase-associated family protein [Pseudomonadota bacterium]|nr:urea carboxylase-associated family protein [Pseudomonadota bacterium]MEC7237948.1 urea carboxylase-associated family protein [Pseudomonadota bacterium]